MTRPQHRSQHAASDHFDGSRFFNPGAPFPNTFARALRWQMTSKKSPWPKWRDIGPTARPLPRVAGGELAVTLVNHATVLVQTAGLNILTDPVWSKRVSPTQYLGPARVHAPGIAFDDLPPIDVVLVSHNHYDHMDLATLHHLWWRDRPLIVTPLGNLAAMSAAAPALTAVELDWGHGHVVRDHIHIDCARVQHWSGRSFHDRMKALWAGFSVRTPGGAVFFAGDCGFGDGSTFREAARSWGPFRLALLPIGAYEPRWFMKFSHMNPHEAVAAFELLHAQHALAIHHGCFQLTDEAIDAPAHALAAALKEAKIAPERFRAAAPGSLWNVPQALRAAAE